MGDLRSLFILCPPSRQLPSGEWSDGAGNLTRGKNYRAGFYTQGGVAHEPQLSEKMTQPPKHYTEATLLRAMETAGKSVDDDELRDLLKENGIGRPSTRANIIETLFKRRYIRRDKKKIIANQMGIDLINLIENDLLKSAELTGQWEKKLREIEAGKYQIATFMIIKMFSVQDLWERPACATGMYIVLML